MVYAIFRQSNVNLFIDILLYHTLGTCTTVFFTSAQEILQHSISANTKVSLTIYRSPTLQTGPQHCLHNNVIQILWVINAKHWLAALLQMQQSTNGMLSAKCAHVKNKSLKTTQGVCFVADLSSGEMNVKDSDIPCLACRANRRLYKKSDLSYMNMHLVCNSCFQPCKQIRF